MISFGKSQGFAVVVAAAVIGAACSNSTSPGSTGALTLAQGDTLSQVVTGDAQSDLDFATFSGAATVGPEALRDNILTGPPACVSRTPASPTNSDGDRVPDSVRITFNDCVVVYPLSSDTVRGSIDVLDPTPTVTDHAWKHVFNDLTRVHVGPAGRETIVDVNGSRQIIGDSAQLAFTSTNMSTTWQFPNGGTASHVRSWSLTFTADTAGSILPDSALPSGSLTIAGNSTWTRGSNTWMVVVSTPSPLHYSAACTVRPKFDSGEIKAVVTRGSNTNNVTIQFTACGTFTVTRS